jgi:LDH2 family malate/lactate/ureidoglycolate dehydrogenase
VFANGVDSLVTSMERSRVLPGSDGVRIPGRESAQREAQYRREGIPLRDVVLRDLVKLGKERGVDVKDLAGA